MKTSKFIEKKAEQPTAISNAVSSPVNGSLPNSKAPSQTRENVHAVSSSRKSSNPVSPKVDPSNGGTERRKFVASNRESRVGRSGLATESAVENLLNRTMQSARDDKLSERANLMDQVPKHASHAVVKTQKFVKFVPTKPPISPLSRDEKANADDQQEAEQDIGKMQKDKKEMPTSPVNIQITGVSPFPADRRITAQNVAAIKKQVRENLEKQYCVFPGNGHQVIRDAMNRKPGWKEVPVAQAFFGRCNFVWRPTNFTYKMYCQVDQLLHKAYVAQDRAIAQCQLASMQAGVNVPGYMGSVHGRDYIEFDPSKEIVVNHLENNREITTKTGLIRSLKNYYRDHIGAIDSGYQVFDTTPTTFLVSSNLDTYEYHQFCNRFQDLKKHCNETYKERMPAKHCQENIWMVKPANENQGKGIKIFKDLEQIIRFLDGKMQYTYWVIQKYLERPLLYKGRKFDIRVWATYTSSHDLYFCDKGYLRTSSFEYSHDVNDEYVHLTNNCLQMQDQTNYGKHEQGNTIRFEDFQEYLDSEYPEHKLDFERDFLRRMKDIAIDCILSAKSTMNPSKRRNSFELFGFDFMIDEDFRIWLIEVNTNPYIGIHNDKMTNILPKMFDGLFKITLDPIFENLQPNQQENLQKDTCWDLLYSRSRGYNKRRAIDYGMYPVKSLSHRRELPRKFYQPKLSKEYRSAWTDTKKKQHRPYRSNHAPDKKDDRGSAGRNSRASQCSGRRSSAERNGLKHSQSAQNIHPDSRADVNQANGNDQMGFGGKRHSGSMQLLDAKSGMFRRSQLAAQMKYRNQQNFIPQPMLDLKRTTGMSQMSMGRNGVSPGALTGRHNSVDCCVGEYYAKETDRLVAEHDNEQSAADCSQGSDDYDNVHGLRGPGSYGMLANRAVQPARTIVALVKNLDTRSKLYKVKTQDIMNRIVSTMLSWELFSDEQIADANQALKLLQQTFVQHPEDQKPMVRSLLRLVGSNEVPLHIRYQIALNVYLMFKSRVFLRAFVHEPIETHTSLKPLYNVLLETCGSRYIEQSSDVVIGGGDIEKEMINKEPERSKTIDMKEEDVANPQQATLHQLRIECINILALIMCLDASKYHIPGETFERCRIKQKSQDAGIMIMGLLIQTQTRSVQLREYLETEFTAKLDEQDVEYHNQTGPQSYRVIHDILNEMTEAGDWHGAIEKTFLEQASRARTQRLKEEKFFNEIKKREEAKEEERRKEVEEALAEKRRVAHEKVEQRLRDLVKVQAEQMRKEQEERRLLEIRQAEIKEKEAEEAKERMEKRRKRQQRWEAMQQKLEQEHQEQIERVNREREVQKRQALQRWHTQKREEERRRRMLEKARIKQAFKACSIEAAAQSFAAFKDASYLYSKANQQRARSREHSLLAENKRFKEYDQGGVQTTTAADRSIVTYHQQNEKKKKQTQAQISYKVAKQVLEGNNERFGAYLQQQTGTARSRKERDRDSAHEEPVGYPVLADTMLLNGELDLSQAVTRAPEGVAGLTLSHRSNVGSVPYSQASRNMPALADKKSASQQDGQRQNKQRDGDEPIKIHAASATATRDDKLLMRAGSMSLADSQHAKQYLESSQAHAETYGKLYLRNDLYSGLDTTTNATGKVHKFLGKIAAAAEKKYCTNEKPTATKQHYKVNNIFFGNAQQNFNTVTPDIDGYELDNQQVRREHFMKVNSVDRDVRDTIKRIEERRELRKLAQRGSVSKFKQNVQASKVLATVSSLVDRLEASNLIQKRDVTTIERSIESLNEESQEVLRVYKNVTQGLSEEQKPRLQTPSRLKLRKQSNLPIGARGGSMGPSASLMTSGEYQTMSPVARRMKELQGGDALEMAKIIGNYKKSLQASQIDLVTKQGKKRKTLMADRQLLIATKLVHVPPPIPNVNQGI